MGAHGTPWVLNSLAQCVAPKGWRLHDRTSGSVIVSGVASGNAAISGRNEIEFAASTYQVNAVITRRRGRIYPPAIKGDYTNALSLQRAAIRVRTMWG